MYLRDRHALAAHPIAPVPLRPERVHAVAVALLRILGWRPIARRLRPRRPPSLEVKAMGLEFEHPLGLAAGFDKGEVVAPGLLALGFSHLEIGTMACCAGSGIS
ncbi:MAG: hypothetical protein A2V77_08010 [Anaeromyxobacter sp. RBG_16_69_14]|nr:MAG: hypothetical protein A2V77_08010 [Anaeromyxobacter sp. RBG_16_69_14]